MGNIVRFVLIFCCYIISNACWYRVGREHGATDVLRRLAGVIIPISKNEYSKLKAENAKLRDLCEWLLNPYRLGAVTGEGVDRQWCRETYDGGSYRLRELGGEVEVDDG